jgi:hypothetical protein
LRWTSRFSQNLVFNILLLLLSLNVQQHALLYHLNPQSHNNYRYHRLHTRLAQKMLGTLAQGAILVVVALGAWLRTSAGQSDWGLASEAVCRRVLTISRLTRWSIGYYTDTAEAAKRSALNARAANGGLGEYYSEADTRVPTWLLTGDQTAVAGLCGLDAAALAGGVADTEAAATWLNDGVAGLGVMRSCVPRGTRWVRHRFGGVGWIASRSWRCLL